MTNILRNLDWSVLTGMVLNIIPALLCITIHELSHGYVAYRLGDDTAKRMGRLTLNPIRHIDLTGLLMMVVFRFGWAKPVPIDMRKFKNPKQGMAITALAGPMSNLILTAVMMALYGFLILPLKGSTVGDTVLSLIGSTAYISTALCIFNLIPIPPLDGSKVLFSVLSEESYYKLMRYERYGMILLVVVMFAGVFSTPMSAAVNFILDKLLIIAHGTYNLMLKFY